MKRIIGASFAVFLCSCSSSPSSTPAASATPSASPSPKNDIYTLCRQEFPKQLDLPSTTPIYGLGDDINSLAINRSNPDSGQVTKLPDNRTILAGQALIEEDKTRIKTRHFTCTMTTSDNSLKDFSRGKDNSWLQ